MHAHASMRQWYRVVLMYSIVTYMRVCCHMSYTHLYTYMQIERSGAESVYGYYMEQMMGGGGVGGKYVGQDSGLTNSLLKSG